MSTNLESELRNVKQKYLVQFPNIEEINIKMVIKSQLLNVDLILKQKNLKFWEKKNDSSSD